MYDPLFFLIKGKDVVAQLPHAEFEVKKINQKDARAKKIVFESVFGVKCPFFDVQPTSFSLGMDVHRHFTA